VGEGEGVGSAVAVAIGVTAGVAAADGVIEGDTTAGELQAMRASESISPGNILAIFLKFFFISTNLINSCFVGNHYNKIADEDQ
jgi:hypothetical protein